MKQAHKYLNVVLGIVLFGAGLVLIKMDPNPQGLMKTLPFLLVGIGCGMFGQGIGAIVNAAALKNHPDIAKQVEIEAKDERNILLGNQAKAKGFDSMTYIFAALMLAYALMGSSLSVLIPFVVAYLLVQGYAVYHRIKLEKEQ